MQLAGFPMLCMQLWEAVCFFVLDCIGLLDNVLSILDLVVYIGNGTVQWCYQLLAQWLHYFFSSHSKRMTARKCLEHSWLSKAKRATTRMTAKSKGKQKSDSCCESLSSNDSPYDISQDSTSSLDVSPLSSASSSFSPAAGKQTDDETSSLTPVKTSQPNLSKVTEKVSSLYLERNNEDVVDSDTYKTSSRSSSFESSKRISDKGNSSVPKSSPYTTPTGSFGSTRSVKQSSYSKTTSPSTSSGSSSNVSQSLSDPVVTSERTRSSGSNSSGVTKSISESIIISPPCTTSAVNCSSQSAATNRNESTIVLRRKTRGKDSTEESPNKNGVVMRRKKVNPESLPNYSRDSYRRNSMNLSDNSSDADVMDFLRKGSDSNATMDSIWPPSPNPVPTSPATGTHTVTLGVISEDSGVNKSLRKRDKSPKISLDAQITLLDSIQNDNRNEDNTNSADIKFQPLPSPKIPLAAIQELKSELQLGLEKSSQKQQEKPQQQKEPQQQQKEPQQQQQKEPQQQQNEVQRQSEEPKKSPVNTTTIQLQTSSSSSSSKNRSKRSSSPKISMEAQLEILDLDISNGNVKPEKHSSLKRKLSQSIEPQNKNPERTTEWKTLPRRRSNAKPSYIVQSKPVNTDTRKCSYTPNGPFQFLPNPNSSRLIDRRPSLPVNSSGSKQLGTSSSTSQLPSRQWNNVSPQHNLDRPTTPLSYLNHSNPSSRSNSPLHGVCSPISLRTATLSPSKISHWKSCEELDK